MNHTSTSSFRLKPLLELTVTPLELYAARCGMVHSHSVFSKLTREGGCRAIGYVDAAIPEIMYDPNVSESLVLVSVTARDMTNSTTNKLRADEKFTIEAVAVSVSGRWWAGENPPDAYLRTENDTIAVEISTLTQYVTDRNGGFKPRLSDDITAVRVCDELNEELRERIPSGRTVLLTLSAPIGSARKMKPILGQETLELVESTGVGDIAVEKEILGNLITIHLVPEDRPSGKKVVGLITNHKSHADILTNARHILADRIAVKSDKCSSRESVGPIWLASFNDYWLADGDTYNQVFDQLSVRHPFEKILLVSGDRTVTTLYEKHYNRLQATQKPRA